MPTPSMKKRTWRAKTMFGLTATGERYVADADFAIQAVDEPNPALDFLVCR